MTNLLKIPAFTRELYAYEFIVMTLYFVTNAAI